MIVLIVVVVSFLRWYLLVRALGLPFQVHEAMRLGFLGYLFNFVSLGSVGGDLLKAVLLARSRPGRRTEAVATVAVDRGLGMLALLAVASVAILAQGLQHVDPATAMGTLVRSTLACTALGALAVTMAASRRVASSGPIHRLFELPLVGPTIRRLFKAAGVYRATYGVVLIAFGMSVVIHVLLAAALWLVARSLPGDPPSLARHLVIVPLAMVAGAVPLPMAGLGALEVGLEYLYRFNSENPDLVRGQGLIVALVYRLITLVVAALGMMYYLAGRREVDRAMHEAEEMEVEGIPDL
jgi:uncharacterized protein (TIRG00374 family)